MKRKFLGMAVAALGFGMMANVQAAPIDDAWDTLVKDGVFEAPCVEPTKEDDAELLMESSTFWYLQENFGNNYNGYLSLNENKEYVLSIDITECGTEYNCEVVASKSERVNVKWKDADSNVKTLIDGYAEELNKLFKVIEYEGGSYKEFYTTILDISRINGIKNSKNGNFYAESALHSSDELLKVFGGSNVEYKLTGRLGDGGPFYGLGGGDLTLWYNGVAYRSIPGLVGVEQFDILYIPEETELNSNAFIAAAKKRLNETFGANVIDVKLGGVFEELEDFDFYNNYVLHIDREKTGDNYYKLTINGKDYNFIIMKNSDIKSLPAMESKDVVTNVSVKTTSPDVPLDAVVKVEEIKSDMPVFKKAYDTIKKDIIKAFDISLTSKTVGVIKKIDKGVFEVKIPLGNAYVGRKLSAYYLREDGTLEEHPITLDNEGNAVFETTHFSEYFIAEAGVGSFNEEVPKTFDKVDLYIILAVSGLIGLFSCIVFFRTKTN